MSYHYVRGLTVTPNAPVGRCCGSQRARSTTRSCGHDLTAAIDLRDELEGGSTRGGHPALRQHGVPAARQVGRLGDRPVRDRRARQQAVQETFGGPAHPPSGVPPANARRQRARVVVVPMCMQMRRFARREGFSFEGLWIGEPAMACPMCGMSHGDASVAKYNPLAQRIGELRRTRSDKGVGR